MADTRRKHSVPIASGGLPASLANTFWNGTIGRIKTMVCTREDPTGQGESFESRRLRELMRQYADHSSGRAPLPPEMSLWLRGEINRLDQIVNPGQTNMWGDYSPAEKAYLARQEAARQRGANDLGIGFLGPVFGALAAAGRVFGAPEQTVEDLARVGVNVAGAKGLGRAGRGIEPVRVPTRMPETSLTWRSPGDGVVVAAKRVESAVKLTFDKSTKTWRTPAGLDYGPGSVHGNRVKHVLDHAVPNPNKTTHSVFNVDRKQVLGLVDEAWIARGNPLANDPGAYVVPMGRVIGTAGETNIKIIVRPGTNEIITSYPFP